MRQGGDKKCHIVEKAAQSWSFLMEDNHYLRKTRNEERKEK